MADWRSGRNGRPEEMMETENQTRVDGLSNKVSRLKGLALDIDTETKEHNRYLDTMGEDFESSQGLLGGSINRISHMMDKGRNNRKMLCYIVIGLVAMFFLIYFLISRIRA